MLSVLQDMYIVVTIVLLTMIAAWNGLASYVPRGSVRTIDLVAAIIFIILFVIFQLVFYVYINRQVRSLDSLRDRSHSLV